VLGVLVHGDNHFIVRGPLPSPEEARALVERWSVIRIGSGVDATRETGPWRVSTREFRENLQWAVLVEAASRPQPAIVELLTELEARHVRIRRLPGDDW
jgi:hypothetical protein